MHWYYTKEQTDQKTPSRGDGVDVETEMRYRKEGARFIMELGNKLGLRYLTMATGIVFFHRFYMNQSFKNFSRWVTGTACLFLAGKVEETPKKCKDVLRMCRVILPDPQWEAFGENPKEEVMMMERILLQTIKFDLQVDHPYQYLIKFGKGLKGDKEKINELVQKAWIFINDSLSTCICLHHKPPVAALAMLHLAAKLSKQNMQNFTPVPMQDWWRQFSPEIEQSVLDDICNEMMDLYDSGRRRSKSREGNNTQLKDGNATDSPAYTPGGSPQVTSSPPAKKKRTPSYSLLESNKARDSPLAKPPQIENISPPVIAKLQHSVSQGAQPTTIPASSAVTTAPTQGHYYQQGYKFKGMPGKDPSPMPQEMGTQQLAMGQQILNTSQMVQNTQTIGSVYSHCIPAHSQSMQPVHGMVPTQSVPPHGQVVAPVHGQVIGARDPIPIGLDQGQYNYGMGQPQQPQQQQQQQQQHLHSYTPTQMPPAAQWQAQQQGLGPGWMK